MVHKQRNKTFFSTSLSLAGNLCHHTWVRHSSRKSSATHSCQCLQYVPVSEQWYACQCLQYVPVSEQCYGCQCLRFSTCARMLVRATAHGSCSNTVGESAPEVNSGRKIRCCTGELNLCQYCAWLSLFEDREQRCIKVINNSNHLPNPVSAVYQILVNLVVLLVIAENLPLLTVFPRYLISVPSFCYSHCVCVCVCVCV